jgi:LmbE family N-acetylglucosaminyl deacetylase
MQRTLLAILAHPDDELLIAGSLLAQRKRGDRVVILYLTRGEATGAFGSKLSVAEVAHRRVSLAAGAAAILDVEHRFLDLPDCGVRATPDHARSVAKVLAELRPDGLVTWGDAWVKGMRHPDHQATGKIARDSVTLARIASVVGPTTPHRGFCPVFTIRGAHSTLPTVSVEVEPHVDGILELADFYHRALGFGDRDWLLGRLQRAGAAAEQTFAEAFDAWESREGVVPALLPAVEAASVAHPTRG